MTNFTLFSIFNEPYAKHVVAKWPTLMKNKAHLAGAPKVVCYDTVSYGKHTRRAIRIVRGHDNTTRFVPFDSFGVEYPSLRERFLTAWVVLPALHCQTQYFLKLDADTAAYDDKPVWQESWFRNHPVFVASPWYRTYNKARTACWTMSLDEWCQKNHLPGVPFDYRTTTTTNGGCVDLWKRCNSWCCYIENDFNRYLYSLVRDTLTLPVPSQDTYLSYMAARLRMPRSYVRFRTLGLGNSRRIR